MSVIRTTALPGQLHNVCNTQRELIHFYVRIPEESGRINQHNCRPIQNNIQHVTVSVKNKRNIDAAGKCDAFLLV